MSHTYYHVLYPEDKFIIDDKIETLYAEARAANEVCIDGVKTVDDMAEALEDAGFIHLAPPPRHAIVNHVKPPIPTRRFDYSAHWQELEDQAEGSTLGWGWGAFPENALAELLSNGDCSD